MIPQLHRLKTVSEQDILLAIAEWSYCRKALYKLLSRTSFDAFMNLIIISNIMLLVFEANESARCYGKKGQESCEEQTLFVVDLAYLAVYAIELFLRIYVFRTNFFKENLNWLDLIIVVLGGFTSLLEIGELPHLPGLEMLRIFRCLRLVRALRLLATFPELARLVHGFFSALSAMFWGMLLISVLLVFLAIITVELVYPVSVQMIERELFQEEWCTVAFESVWHVIVLYFQTIVIGDSWGECIRPMIVEHEWTALIFVSAFVIIELGFTNLILAVVVDSAHDAREADAARRLLEKKQKEKTAVAQLESVMAACDIDDSGEITLTELYEGCAANAQVSQLFEFLGIDEEDLDDVFHLMDVDESGSITYQEFITCLRKAEMQDQRLQMMLLKLQVSQLQRFFSSGRGSVRGSVLGSCRGSVLSSCPTEAAQPKNHATDLVYNGTCERKLDELSLSMSKLLSSMLIMEQTLRSSLCIEHVPLQDELESVELLDRLAGSMNHLKVPSVKVRQPRSDVPRVRLGS